MGIETENHAYAGDVRIDPPAQAEDGLNDDIASAWTVLDEFARPDSSVEEEVVLRAVNVLRDCANDPNWRDKALCRQTDPALFEDAVDKDSGKLTIPQSHKDAKIICLGCEALVDCLISTLDRKAKDSYGIWGGLNYGQRNKVSKVVKKKT